MTDSPKAPLSGPRALRRSRWAAVIHQVPEAGRDAAEEPLSSQRAKGPRRPSASPEPDVVALATTSIP